MQQYINVKKLEKKYPVYGIFIPSLYLPESDKAKYVPAVATFLIPYAAVLISKIPFSKMNISFSIQSIKSYALPFLCIITLSIKMAESSVLIKNYLRESPKNQSIRA